MKKTLTKILFATIIVSVAFTSCKKSKKVAPVGPLGANYPYILNSIITPAILDTLQKHGLHVHAGLTPAIVNGIYLLSPDECLYDNTGDYSVGEDIDDYKYQFSSQDNTTYTVSVAYTDVTSNNDSGSDNAATYISGTGTSFTIFAQAQGTLSGVSYTTLSVFSGILTSGGIQDFQNGLFLKSKVGDADNEVVAPVGTIRIFENPDLSATQTSFAHLLKQIGGIHALQAKSLLSKKQK
jgi:hypothetical protein